MLADKLNFGVMGDYPLIVNGAKFQKTDSLRSLYVAGTGYNLKVPATASSCRSSPTSIQSQRSQGPLRFDPGWLRVLGHADQGAGRRRTYPGLDLDLRNQSPPVGAANIATGKIDAHADFCPWTEIMQFRGTGRKIYDGSQTGVPYLHGLVVRKDFRRQVSRDRRRLHQGDL